MTRPSYDESVAVLKERVDIVGDALPSIGRPPRHDDAEMGPSIFRMLVEDVSLEALTLPALFVGRSELVRVSFARSDLHLSTFNWSDLANCDFSGADLSGSDVRACRFVRCNFSGARLADADLRGSRFDGCAFTGADLHNAVLGRRPWLLGLIRFLGGPSLPLSAEQRRQVRWSSEASEPGGG